MAIDFESVHKRFDGMIFDLCAECGGLCEKAETSLFFPGEVEFISSKMDMNPAEFIKKFCSTVMYKGHLVHILKVGYCPFLNKEHRCELEPLNCKNLRCLFYPVLIGIRENKVKIFVDNEGCPMADRISKEFKDKAFKLLGEIKKDIPLWWLKYATKYDECYYEYSKLEKLKDKDIILAEELDECMIKGDK